MHAGSPLCYRMPMTGTTDMNHVELNTHEIQHDPPVLFYFAYGSNMSTPRLLNRVVSARAVAVACLPAHALRFHKRGRDGSAKCDAFYTGQDHDELHGVVYRIAAAEKPCLDECEGLGNGYDVKTVTVLGKNGTNYRAFTYCATRIDARLRPFHWYREHVLRGAIEHGLQDAYIATIRGIESIADPQQHQHERELAIYPD